MLACSALLLPVTGGCATQAETAFQRPGSALACTAATRHVAVEPKVAAERGDWVDDERLASLLRDAADKMLAADAGREVATPEQLQAGLDRKRATLSDLPAVQADPVAGPALYKQAREAVALVGSAYKCPNCDNWHTNAASGFFIAADGVLVTNHHVLASDADGQRALFAMLPSGRTFALKEVLAANERADVAIVRVDPVDQDGNNAPVPALPLAAASATGQAAWVLSNPDGRYFALTNGIVSRRYLQDNTPWMTVTADYARGSSGGPVLDAAGNVIGLVSSTNSVYYDTDDERGPQNLQMVWKQCVPVENVLALLAPDEVAAGTRPETP